MPWHSDKTGRQGRAGREPGGAPASLEDLLRAGLVQVGVGGLGQPGTKRSSRRQQPEPSEQLPGQEPLGEQLPGMQSAPLKADAGADPGSGGAASARGGKPPRRQPRRLARTWGRGEQRPSGEALEAEKVPVGELALDQQTDLAREVALKSLTACARTRQQLAQTLGRKGFAPQAIETVLDRLTEVGLIDDAGYAAALVRTRSQERGLARKAIAVELARKGIDPQVAAAALRQLSDEDELSTALELARAKARSTRRLEYAVRLRRIVAHLGRKGYNSEIALSAARAALAEE